MNLEVRGKRRQASRWIKLGIKSTIMRHFHLCCVLVQIAQPELTIRDWRVSFRRSEENRNWSWTEGKHLLHRQICGQGVKAFTRYTYAAYNFTVVCCTGLDDIFSCATSNSFFLKMLFLTENIEKIHKTLFLYNKQDFSFLFSIYLFWSPV